MGKRYDQLDLDDRIEIGRLMGRDASTISRELPRNCLSRGEYTPLGGPDCALAAPGYSITMHLESPRDYDYPQGSAWR